MDPAFDKLKRFLGLFSQGTSGYIGLVRADRDVSNEKANKKWESHRNWFVPVQDGDTSLDYNEVGSDPELEYYFTPAVLSEESRLQSKFKSSNVIWIDFDEPVDWRAFNPAPSIVVQTSAEKHHCYWLLRHPITDVNDMRYWCRRFLGYFGNGDQSGFDATQLLKLPWGLNLKLGSQEEGEFFEPRVVKLDESLRYDRESEFSHMPEPEVPAGDAPDLEGIGAVPDASKYWGDYAEEYKVKKALRDRVQTPDPQAKEGRSGNLFSVTCSLFEQLGDVEKVFQVLHKSPVDKFSTDHGARKGAGMLWRDVNRVCQKQAARADEDHTAEDNPGFAEKPGEGKVDRITRILRDQKTPYRERANAVAKIVLEDLRTTGTFIRTDMGARYYAENRTGLVQLYFIQDGNKADGLQFRSLLQSRYGLNAGADATVINGAIGVCTIECLNTSPTIFNKFTHYDMKKEKVYVDRYDGSMYVLDGTKVAHEPYGYDGVYFNTREPGDTFPLSFEYKADYTRGKLDELIMEGPNFLLSDGINRKDLRHLLKTWVSAFFFGSLMSTRPIVLIYGPADSGKTTQFQNLSIMFTGDSTFSVTAIPESGKAFDTQITNSPYVFFDNVEVNEPKLQEKLAQVATGTTVKMRELYTTNTQRSLKVSSFVGITSRTLDKIQEDVVQRYIILPVTPFTQSHERKAMSAILSEIMKRRDELWSEMLDYVNTIVHHIRQHGLGSVAPSKLRMADYGILLGITGDMDGFSATKLENFILKMQAETFHANDPMFDALNEYIASRGGEGDVRVTSAELYKKLTKVRRKIISKYPTPNKFTTAVKGFHERGDFEKLGVPVKTYMSGKNLRIVLSCGDSDSPFKLDRVEGNDEDGE